MQPADLPTRRDPALPYRLSLAVATLVAVTSVAGIALGLAGLYGPDPMLAVGVTEAEAGLLLPGLLGQDIFGLVVGLPILLGAIWLAHRGSLVGLLLWPGALFYALYWGLLYLTGAPFSALFLLYVPLVVLSAYATISVVSSIDAEKIVDTRWSWLYGIGGAAALFGAALVPMQAVVFVIWGQPETALGWFELFRESKLGGLLAFELLFVVNAVLSAATTLALYVALRRVGESLMALALVLGLLQSVTFIVARPALEMLYLSDRYASAATDAERELFLAAGEAVLATFHGTAFHVGINLFSVYLLIVPIVMLRGGVFGRPVAYAGISAAVLNWGLYVPGTVGLILLTVSVLPLLVWNVLIARRLLGLARMPREETGATPKRPRGGRDAAEKA